MLSTLSKVIKRFAKDGKMATKCIHSGLSIDPKSGAVVTPIYQTSTFAQVTPGENHPDDCMYTRLRNPTRTALETRIADLEGGKFCVVASSGMGALTSVLFSILKQGDHLVCIDDVYGGTREFNENFLPNFGIDVTHIDMTDMELVKETASKQNTAAVLIESPTNPGLKITDIQAVCDTVKAINEDIIIVIDNTFMSPYFQKPLDLGVDIVMHSCTKYINGHADVVMGANVCNDEELYDIIRYGNQTFGPTASPLDCFLALRGITTLPVRMEKHQENAFIVAQYLENHPKVQSVLYPGLESHPQHDIAKKQMSGYGGMITFFIDSEIDGCERFLVNLELFTLAVSLGGVESLAEHPALMTHRGVPVEVREEIGLLDNLVRLSVGIEDVDDLLEDLERALSFV